MDFQTYLLWMKFHYFPFFDPFLYFDCYFWYCGVVYNFIKRNLWEFQIDVFILNNFRINHHLPLLLAYQDRFLHLRLANLPKAINCSRTRIMDCHLICWLDFPRLAVVLGILGYLECCLSPLDLLYHWSCPWKDFHIFSAKMELRNQHYLKHNTSLEALHSWILFFRFHSRWNPLHLSPR